MDPLGAVGSVETTPVTEEILKPGSGSPASPRPQPAETKDYCMQQTMVRVKDPAVSMKFYCEVLGFKLLMYRDFPQWGFSVYFVAHGLSGERRLPTGLEMSMDVWRS